VLTMPRLSYSRCGPAARRSQILTVPSSEPLRGVRLGDSGSGGQDRSHNHGKTHECMRVRVEGLIGVGARVRN